MSSTGTVVSGAAGRPGFALRCLCALIGVSVAHHAQVREALRTPRIARVVAALIAIRARRLIGAWFGRRGLHESVASGEMAVDPATLSRPERMRSPAVPKLVFQTWKSKQSLPRHFARWSESLRRANADHAYVLWDDADNRAFIAADFPWFLSDYDAYPAEIFRVDAVRYFFLYRFGGVYADLDTQCVRPLGSVLRSGDVWLGRMGQDPAFAHSIPNAMMASRPLQEFWLLVIDMLQERAAALRNGTLQAGPPTVTGPILLKDAYDAYMTAPRSSVRQRIHRVAARLRADLQPDDGPSQVTLLDPAAWYPLDWSNIVHLRLCREVVARGLSGTTARWLFPGASLVTYWTHSW